METLTASTSHAHMQPQHHTSAAVVSGARRASFFTLIFQSSGTDGLAAAIRNDRSPLQRYILKNKQIPGSPAYQCELVPVQ